MASGMSEEQLRAITVSERTMSALSIAGSLFIMVTFLKWHYFRKPINRLVFYASFGNVLANVATMIGTADLPSPGESIPSLCTFQGVLIQWFMMADSLWVVCMAANVMLVFFYRYNSLKLRRLEKWYLCFSYGAPFSIVVLYLIVEKATQKPIFGPATMWCWIHPRVEWMRLAFFYVPVWCSLTVTIIFYMYTGYHIFSRGKVAASASNRDPIVENPFTAANAIECKTEISVRYAGSSEETESTIADHKPSNDSRSSFSSTRNLSSMNPSSPTSATAVRPIASNPQAGDKKLAAGIPNDSDGDANPHYKAAVTGVANANHNPNLHRNIAMEQNHAAWSYFKVAFLMFSALFIVWVPSTINRIQQFVDPAHPRFGLTLASALVLPLQGFWNAMVYVSTTWPECKRAWRDLYGRITGRKPSAARSDIGRNDLHRTRTGSETQEFDSIDAVALREALKQGNELQRSEESITYAAKTHHHMDSR
ncbi:family A G protein-coupled receptor-like protein [Westerdykella ornata]|uniref:Family A G protein-coupled receptor-like protein n=1 Tax=Westerdykella ornata TaxID=318751 RepID=A0A6A6JJ66_WESOR|nr:family A G protein-coupled receptor-like protein [Westerdykella ornata]KAF2276008.1 family A G protein-coupled receptor-like protein [Westerdykella ornata]